MSSIYDIIQELNLENGSNYKLSILKKHKDNELFQRVLKMTYDTVAYNYYIKKIPSFVPSGNNYILEHSLDLLEALYTREKTGHEGIAHLQSILASSSPQNCDVITKIIGRDLKINIGKTQINKVFPGLITKPVYMRCDVYGDKTAKNISFPAIVQLKADGTYREFNVSNGTVSSRSRSGEEYEYPVIFEQMKDFPDGIYTGELTVKNITERSKGNGLINSDNPPHDDIILELWDYITHDEYNKARLKDKKNPCVITYTDRWNKLLEIVHVNKSFDNVKLIPHECVNNLQEALEKTSEWMSQGFEGSILKDWNGVYKDGTSKQQLKLKLQIDLEVRLVGFHEGTVGTKREGKIGSLVFANDEGTIKGRCSGFTDEQLDEFTEKQDELLGKVFSVQFNDLTQAEGNDYYALSHPRFIEFRNDKDETDTLEKAFQLREMAINLK